MKRPFVPLLSAALCLCLAACGGAPETAAPTSPAVTAPALSEPSGVFTDWSLLTTDAAPEERYSRLSAQPLTEVSAGNYGLLLPFEGERQFDEWGWLAGSKWGLVTAEGRIVLDAVCSDISRLRAWEDGAYAQQPLAYYRLEKMLRDPEAPDADEYNDGWITRCAVCALDGSWSTGFDYVGVLPSAAGAVCILDYENNAAVCYAEDGSVVYDTRDWPVREQLDSYSIYVLGDLSGDAYVPVPLADGGYVFVNRTGELLETGAIGHLEAADGFSEGLAAVQCNGLWGYIDQTGQWAIQPQFEGYVQPFRNGQALVVQDTGSLVIDRQGQVLTTFPSDVYRQDDGQGGVFYYTFGAEPTYYDAAFQRIDIQGQTPAFYYGLGFLLRTDEGITLRTAEGKELLFSGAESVSGGDGFYAVRTADGACVTDARQNPILDTGDYEASFQTDSCTGEVYIFVPVGNTATSNVYTADGRLLVTQCSYAEPVDGLFYCADAVSIGYKNTDNEWVFRVRMDMGD